MNGGMVMKAFYQMIQPWDVIIILMLIAISLLPIGVFSYFQAEKVDKSSTFVAVISQNNEVIKRMPLTGHVGKETFDIKINEHKTNTIEIIDESIRIKGATCSDQVCVRTNFISKPGETIVCLPHKLLIEIKTNHDDIDDITISS